MISVRDVIDLLSLLIFFFVKVIHFFILLIRLFSKIYTWLLIMINLSFIIFVFAEASMSLMTFFMPFFSLSIRFSELMY